MADGEQFIDYYRILQVSPNCSARALEAAYRALAKMYHPDHIDTADVTRFNEVIEAYRAIRNPDERAEYDLAYTRHTGFTFFAEDADLHDEKSAVSDDDIHTRILLRLYKRRRESANDAGVGHYAIQDMLKCSDENFEFHIWYLKSKGFAETTEEGTLAITVEGVDHVISMSRTTLREKLLITQASDPDAMQA